MSMKTFAEIHGLAAKDMQAISELKNQLLRALPEEIQAIVLFGSKARGDASELSDIDILVISERDDIDVWDKVHEASSSVSLDYDVFLSVKIMDTAHLNYLRSVDSYFIKNVEKDGASIWAAA